MYSIEDESAWVEFLKKPEGYTKQSYKHYLLKRLRLNGCNLDKTINSSKFELNGIGEPDITDDDEQSFGQNVFQSTKIIKSVSAIDFLELKRDYCYEEEFNEFFDSGALSYLKGDDLMTIYEFYKNGLSRSDIPFDKDMLNSNSGPSSISLPQNLIKNCVPIVPTPIINDESKYINQARLCGSLPPNAFIKRMLQNTGGGLRTSKLTVHKQAGTTAGFDTTVSFDDDNDYQHSADEEDIELLNNLIPKTTEHKARPMSSHSLLSLTNNNFLKLCKTIENINEIDADMKSQSSDVLSLIESIEQAINQENKKLFERLYSNSKQEEALKTSKLDNNHIKCLELGRNIHSDYKSLQTGSVLNATGCNFNQNLSCVAALPPKANMKHIIESPTTGQYRKRKVISETIERFKKKNQFRYN